MAIAIKFDESVGCYFVRWTGAITAEEYQSSYRIVFAKPWFKTGLNAIHDNRNAVMEFVRTDVLTKAHTYDMVASVFGEGKGASLVSSVEDKRLLETFVSASVKAKDMVKIFVNYDDARAWVGLPEDYPDPSEDAW